MASRCDGDLLKFKLSIRFGTTEDFECGMVGGVK